MKWKSKINEMGKHQGLKCMPDGLMILCQSPAVLPLLLWHSMDSGRDNRTNPLILVLVYMSMDFLLHKDCVPVCIGVPRRRLVGGSETDKIDVWRDHGNMCVD